MRLGGTPPLQRRRVSLTFLPDTTKPPTCGSVGGLGG